MRYFILILACLFHSSAESCTAFHLQSGDGAWVYCRSLEFGMALDSHLLIVPRETAYTGTTPGGGPGFSWKTKYGFVGLNQWIDRTLVSDGMNEKGLVVGMLYLPGYAQYETGTPTRRTIGGWELGTFVLGSCATVTEAKTILASVFVAQEPTPGIDFSLPLHFYIADSTGAVIIVEYVEGKRHVYDNPIGILTNSPPFDWQMTNLSNYVKLSPVNVPETRIGDWKIPNFSQGSGALGMPGDSTAPSRFVRAAFYSHWAKQAPTAEESVRLGFHILNTFDLFDGAIQEKSKDQGVSSTDVTEWAVVHDQMNLKTYIRTYESLSIERVDLKKIDFGKPGLKEILISKKFTVTDVTSNAISAAPKAP